MTFINGQNVSNTLLLKLIKQTKKKNQNNLSLTPSMAILLLDARRRRRPRRWHRLIHSLPDDLTVPRSHYPILSLVSKSFRNLTASSKLYKRRSQLGITQHRVYAVLRNRSTGDFSFYITQQCVSVGILPSVFRICIWCSVLFNFFYCLNLAWWNQFSVGSRVLFQHPID